MSVCMFSYAGKYNSEFAEGPVGGVDDVDDVLVVIFSEFISSTEIFPNL